MLFLYQMFITSFQTVHHNVLKTFAFPELKTSLKAITVFMRMWLSCIRKQVYPQAECFHTAASSQLLFDNTSDIF